MISFFDNLMIAIAVATPLWLLGGGWEFLVDFFTTEDVANGDTANGTLNAPPVVVVQTPSGTMYLSMIEAQLAEVCVRAMRGELQDAQGLLTDEVSIAESFRAMTGLSSRQLALEILRAYEAQEMSLSTSST